MALAGYPSHYYTDSTALNVPASPRLQSVMNVTNAQIMNNFMNQLFHVRENHFKIGGKLRNPRILFFVPGSRHFPNIILRNVYSNFLTE